MKSKKILAIVLAIAMVFGVVSLASAAPSVGGFADTQDSKHHNQIAYLKAVGVALGDNLGNFNPDSPLTRQEFVTFVARLSGQQAAADFLAGVATRYTDDKDIADWARGAVNLADTQGWVQGYPDGKFHPLDTLTYAQAVTVLVRVLGHEAQVTGGYPNGYIIKGITIGLNDGVNLSANTPITRGDMGRLLYNALGTERLQKVGDNWVAQPSILEEGKVFGRAYVGELDVNAVNNVYVDNDDFDDDFKGDHIALHNDVIFIGSDTTNVAALNGLNVRATVKDGRVTVIEVLGDHSAAVKIYKTYEKVNDRSTNWTTKWYAVFEDGTKVEVDDNTNWNVNGTALTGTLTGATDAAFEADLKDKLKAGDQMVVTSAGGLATNLSITRVSAANQIVSAAGKIKEKAADPQDHFKIVAGVGEATIETGSAAIRLNGEPATVADLKVDDVVNLTLVNQNAGFNPTAGETYTAIKVEATRQTVQGAVTKIKTGTSTTITLKLEDDSTADFTLVAGIAAPDLNDVVKLHLNAAGDVAKITPVAGTAAKYVLLKGYYQVKDAGGTSHYAVIDKSGEELEVKVSADVSAYIGKIVTIDGGVVTPNYAIDDVDTAATIISVDVANNRVTLQAGVNVRITTKGFAIYAETADGKFGSWVSLEDLSAGQEVSIALVGGTEADQNEVAVILVD